MIKSMNKSEKEMSKEYPDHVARKFTKKDFGGGSKPSGSTFGWKVGAYEVTDSEHGDIAYLYTIDMEKTTVSVANAYGEGEAVSYSYEDFIKTDFSNWED